MGTLEKKLLGQERGQEAAPARPAVRPSHRRGGGRRPQEASLDIQPLSVRKFKILFFRTLSR